MPNSMYSYLAGLGYTGSLSDKQNAYFTDLANGASASVRNLNNLTIVGDSIANGSGSIDPANPSNAQNQGSRGFAEIANMLSGHRCQMIYPAAGAPGSIAAGGSGIGFCKGADYTDDMLGSGGMMAAAVASAANIILVHIGTNNVNRGDTALKIITDLLTIWRQATNLGKRVIATSIMPRDSTVITGAKLLVMLDVNNQIRQNAATEPGVYFCDWYTGMLDSAGAPPGTGATAWFSDGLHPNGNGAWRMGSILAPILANIVGTAKVPGDYLPLSAGGNVLTPNPFATGNVAGIATSWTVTNVGAPTSVTPTKVARATTDMLPGEWQQVACVAATADTDGYQLASVDSTTSDWTVGDTAYACAEIQADAAGWDCRGLQLDLVMSGVAGVASDNLIPSAERTVMTIPFTPAPTGGLVMVTPRITIPASVTALRAIIRFFGSGTIRVSRMAVRKN